MLRREVGLHPRPFAAGVFGAVVFASATVGSSWVLGRVVDRVIRPRFEVGDVQGSTIAFGAAAIVAVGVLKAAGIVCRRVGASLAKFGVDATLREQVVAKYQQLPLQWHQSLPTGRLLSHSYADIEAAADILAPLPYATGVVALLLITAAWMVLTDPFLAVIGLLLLPVLVVMNLVFQRQVEHPAQLERQRVGDVSAVAHESFDGAMVVKTLGAEDAETERFRREAEALRDAKVTVSVLRSRFETLIDAVPAVGTIAVLVVGAWRVEAGAITPGTLVAFVNLLTLLVFPLRLIGYVLGDIPRTVASFDRIDWVLNQEAPVRAVRRAAPSAGVEVEHLSFAYGDNPPALVDVSFSLRPGSTVAVVGPTGSGKTTLLLLLARLLEPGSGAIHAPDDIALAFQEAFLFSETLRDNIALGREVTHEQVEAAARVARIHDFIVSLPDGYDTVVGERGATLSGGQRQRVALARALVTTPHLLLLDDATSAVDPTTEAAILDALRGRLRETTTVMVATRPSTVALADEVLFLADGRVQARGTHEELLATVPGYALLARAYEQAGVSP